MDMIQYSMFGHIRRLAEAEKRGIEAAGGSADLFQSVIPGFALSTVANITRIAEILPGEVLAKVGAPPKDDDIPIAKPGDLEDYDGFLFGVPTRYGTFPTHWTAFWEAAGPQWRSGALRGRLVGAFVCCSNMGAGMETTVANLLPTFANHGLTYVPMGGVNGDILGTLEEVSGGSPWGAGCFTVRLENTQHLFPH